MRLSFLFILLFPFFSFAQLAPAKYWIQFTDKNNNPYSISDPSQFLSSRAIDRRNKQGIAVQLNDLPLTPAYIDSVGNTGVSILNKSKWLNGLIIQTTDSLALVNISLLPFVNKIDTIAKFKKLEEKKAKKFKEELVLEEGDYNYGISFNQLHMVGGEGLHEKGYQGQGMIIAVLDAGFWKVDSLAAFDNLRANNQILGTWDFVANNDSVYEDHSHGMSVLSTMAGNLNGQLIGTSPKANFWLLRSEDAGSEYIIEEYNWVVAAEFADSVGADIITSSLGYTIFDIYYQNHTYNDMDGNTCPSSIGADIAASKGILVVNSAGNEGASSWKYIGAPADGDSVLAVGAVDVSGVYASFSSNGPSVDGQIKPNVAAQGQGAVVASTFGGVQYANGTSFSCPLIAGMVACLWQANPDLTNMELIDAIQKSASQYENPDALLGYGIPNFFIADTILAGLDSNLLLNSILLNIYPNPFNGNFKFDFYSEINQTLVVELYDLLGRRILSLEKSLIINSYNIITVAAENLERGIYILQLIEEDCFGEISTLQECSFKRLLTKY